MSKQLRAGVHVGGCLKLQNGIADAIVFCERRFDIRLDLLSIGKASLFDYHMAIERDLVFLHLPKMHVMNIGNTVHAPDHFHDPLAVYVRRAAQHQRPDWAADLGHSELENVKRDTNCDRRINPLHVIENDERATDNHGD